MGKRRVIGGLTDAISGDFMPEDKTLLFALLEPFSDNIQTYLPHFRRFSLANDEELDISLAVPDDDTAAIYRLDVDGSHHRFELAAGDTPISLADIIQGITAPAGIVASGDLAKRLQQFEEDFKLFKEINVGELEQIREALEKGDSSLSDALEKGDSSLSDALASLEDDLPAQINQRIKEAQVPLLGQLAELNEKLSKLTHLPDTTLKPMAGWVDLRSIDEATFLAQVSAGISFERDPRWGIRYRGASLSWNRAVKFETAKFAIEREHGTQISFCVFVEDLQESHLIGLCDSDLDIHKLDNKAFYRGAVAFQFTSAAQKLLMGNSGQPAAWGSDWYLSVPTGASIPTGGRWITLTFTLAERGFASVEMYEVASDDWNKQIKQIFRTEMLKSINESAVLVPFWVVRSESPNWWLAGIKKHE